MSAILFRQPIILLTKNTRKKCFDFLIRISNVFRSSQSCFQRFNHVAFLIKFWLFLPKDNKNGCWHSAETINSSQLRLELGARKHKNEEGNKNQSRGESWKTFWYHQDFVCFYCRSLLTSSLFKFHKISGKQSAKDWHESIKSALAEVKPRWTVRLWSIFPKKVTFFPKLRSNKNETL